MKRDGAWPIDLILEAGVNHEGDLSNALRMVDLAATAGVKAIKFQTYTAEKLAAKNSPSYWDTSKEPTKSQIELFRKYDKFGLEEYTALSQRCEEKGIEFATTFFDLDWLHKMDHLVTFYKVASADLTNYVLVREFARRKKPIILSTGASTIEEIKKTLEEIFRINDQADVTLMHCVLNYPTNIEKAFLERITHLRSSFADLKIGYSDHTTSENAQVVIGTAVALGASVVETHFTFNKCLSGNDHYHSLDIEDVMKLQDSLKLINKIKQYSELSFIEAQQEARKYARRGIYANADIEKNQVIKDSDLIMLRPIQSQGIPAELVDQVVGSKAKTKIHSGEFLTTDWLAQDRAN